MTNKIEQPDVLAAIESASTDDLVALRTRLISDVMAIDARLARGGRDENGDYELPANEYFDWRKRAISAKYHKIRQQMAIKAELKRRGAPPSSPEGSGKFWMGLALDMLRALESINGGGTAEQASLIAAAAISEFRDRVASKNNAAA